MTCSYLGTTLKPISLSDEHLIAPELNALGRLEQGAYFGVWQGQSCVGTALVLLRLLTLGRYDCSSQIPCKHHGLSRGGGEQRSTLVR